MLLKSPVYVAGLLGLVLLSVLVIHADVPAILRTWRVAGSALLWLVPYRMIFFVLYAIGWRAMLRPFDPTNSARFGYVLWVTTVREAVDRLLPVASVGGGVVGVRLISWRGPAVVPVSATVIVEILLTLFALYLFGALATWILLGSGSAAGHWQVLLVLALSLLIPVGSLLLLRYGSVFRRMQGFLSPFVGLTGAQTAAALDQHLHACLSRVRTLLMAGALQLLALVSAAFEIWWALRLFNHPISAASSVMLEGMMQAVRHLAFIVPAGLGVQEAALVLFGHALGVGTELALAVSAVKRAREVLCGVPPLLSWQWLEARRLRAAGAL
jgi:putative membrane protein